MKILLFVIFRFKYGRKRKIFGKRGKTISIKKFVEFLKEKIDYIICNLNEISKYLRYFIR